MLNLEVEFKVKQKVKIGEVSRIVGINASAIRFYERNGLINSSSVRRAENGYRIYSQSDIDEIKLIVQFKEFGLELKEIKYLLGGKSRSCGDLVASLDDQLEKCRNMELLIKARIGALMSAKESCEIRCLPEKDVRKCCSK